MSGDSGTSIVPLNFSRSSPPGGNTRLMRSFGLTVAMCSRFVHGSQLSGIPSPSPSVFGGLGGQLALVPVHVSATSQPGPAGRQTVPEGTRASGGHASLMPSQLSAASQTSIAGRHAAVLFTSGGQAALDPEQFSAMSHTPPEGRHTVLDGRKASAGQFAPLPLQVSAASQAP